MNQIIKITRQGMEAKMFLDLLEKVHSFFDELSLSKKTSNIEISFLVEFKFNDFNEIEYNILENEKMELVVKNKKYYIDYNNIFAEIFDGFDDDIMEQLSNIDVSFDDSFEVLKEKIKNTYPIESLYYRIKHREEKGIKYQSRIDLLYYITLQRHLVKDQEIVKDFLDNFYSAKYVDLLLTYMALPKRYYDNAIKDPELNQAIKQEIIKKTEELPAVEEILKTNNFNEIESYYFKIWENDRIPNKSEIVMTLFKKGFTTEAMIRDLLERYDQSMVLSTILVQFKCPEDIMINNIKYPHYIELIISNKNATQNVLHELVNNYHFIIPNEKIFNVLLNHPNLSDFDKQIILNRNEIMDKVKMINESFKQLTEDKINEELSYLSILLKKKNCLSMDDLEKCEHLFIKSNSIHQMNGISEIEKNKMMINNKVLKYEDHLFEDKDFSDFDEYKKILVKELALSEKDEHGKLIPTKKLMVLSKHPFFESCDDIIGRFVESFFNHTKKTIEESNNLSEITRTLENIVVSNGEILNNLIKLPVGKQIELWHKAKEKVSVNNENTVTYFNNLIEFKK